MSRAGVALVGIVLVGAACFVSNDFEKVDDGAGGTGASATTSGGSGPGGTGSTGGAGGTGGSGGTGGAGGTGGTGGGAPELCPNDVCLPACDDFDGGSLTGWNVSTPPAMGQTVEILNQELVVTIDATVPDNYAWYNEQRGWWAWRPACNDFAATVKVSVAAASGSGAPSADFNSGGLLVRSANADPDPNNGGDFWAMVNIGRQGSMSQLGAETKGTQHSVSNPITFHDVLGGMLEGSVGMCRVGDMLHLSASSDGRNWQHLATYGPNGSGTPDGEVSLENDVELGLVVNGYLEQDAQVTFDAVTFWIPTSAAQCPGGGPPN